MAKKTDRKADLVITVIDQNGQPWSGLRLELPDAVNEVVAEGRTDDNGEGLIDIATTTLKELMAPDDKIKVTLSESGNFIASAYIPVHWNTPRERWEAKAHLYKQEEDDVEVPSVLGLSLAEAEIVVKDAFLEPESQEVESKDQVEGTILSQSPEPGQWVEKGSPVNMTVAAAVAEPLPIPDTPPHPYPPEVEPVIMVPPLIGLRAGEARQVAQWYKLPIAFPPDTNDYDLIIDQDPPPGQCQSQFAAVAVKSISYTVELTRICGRLCLCEDESDDCCDDDQDKKAERSRLMKGLARAQVCVYHAGTDEQCCCEDTAYDGTFCCSVPPGEWDVVLPQVDGYKTVTPGLERLRVHVVEGQKIDLAPVCYVARGGQVTGVVYYDRDNVGAPAANPRLPDSTLTLYSMADRKTRLATSDAHGVFLFDNLPSGYYQLQTAASFTHRHHGPLQAGLSSTTAIYIDPGSTEWQDIVYLAAGGEVEGHLFYDANGSGAQFGGEPGIPNVPVQLVDQRTHNTLTDFTNADGDYLFTGVAPGSYRVVFTNVVTAAVAPLPLQTLSLSTSAEHNVNVVVGRRAPVPPTGYGPERHIVSGTLMIKDGGQGQGAVDHLVYITDGANRTYKTTTDRQGKFSYEFADAPGEIKLEFYAPTEDNLTNFDNQPVETRTVYLNHPVSVGTVWFTPRHGGKGGGQRGGQRGSGLGRQSTGGDDLQDAVVDIAAYMPTAADVGAGGGGGGGWSTADTLPLQQTVDRAITEVLGRKLQENDPTAFLAALERSFTIDEADENRHIRWTPRLYAIRTELGGAITGAQASLYHRAKTAIDDALPLLAGLEPLLAAPDEEEVAAVRAIVRTEMTELVNELGLEGGPRVQRVDSILRLLRQEIDRLGVVFGLDPQNVITVAEEEALTNYIVIRDYIESFNQTWLTFHDQFLGIGSSFLGTQLVLLQRALSVVVESVEEAYRAMDSVNLGPNERQTVNIPVPHQDSITVGRQTVIIPAPGQDSITVEELLSWVTRFAREEAPALVLEGGRRGVAAIQPIAAELADLVEAAATANTGNVGFSRPRVRRTLTELQAQLEHVDDLCNQLLPSAASAPFSGRASGAIRARG